ncbi:hypothetical protein A0O32_1027 [Anoxybacillus flavithermus]|uniref:Uncharacterized protein n=1 Tax=Anoxybacillus flavithermus TaxID=33934 RepID=A0A178T441_9BACL|nr:hypothetical protein TAF16_2924 [Anoxybacillus flavithermus]OAO81830.1 hypothetical protein A0O32_1027 [Anoxybacillus flavithermus]
MSLHQGRRLYMKTLLILGVIAAFLVAIFTAGYNDKPEVKN